MRLRTIAARQVWDGRKARGGSGFIPGIRHFQAGVRAYRAAAAGGDPQAAARLDEIDAALDALARSLDRWRRGLAAFAAERAPLGAGAPTGRRWLRTGRLLRVRAPETRRLAALVEAYDAACADTASVTTACRRRGIANPHRASIGDRRRRLRAVMELGYRGARHQPGRRDGRSADVGREAVGGRVGARSRSKPRPR